MIGNTQKTKVLSDSYLYAKADYSKEIFNYLMTADIIDKNSEAFADVLYEFTKRQISPVLVKVLKSNKVVLTIGKRQCQDYSKYLEKQMYDVVQMTKHKRYLWIVQI